MVSSITALPERHKAALSLVTATGLYGMYGVYARFAGASFDAYTIILVRNILVVLILAIIVALFHYRPWSIVPTHDLKWMALWAITKAVSSVLYLLAIFQLTIGTTTLVYYAGSLLSAYFIGWILFSERITARKILAIVLATAGLVVIATGDLDMSNLYLVGLAALAGMLNSFWNIISKKFKGEYTSNQLAMIDAILAVVIFLPLVFIIGSKAPAVAMTLPWLIIIAYALSQVLTLRLIVYGFRNLEAQMASMVMPTDLFFAILFGFLFFTEIPTSTMLIGAVFVALATVATTVPLPLPHMTNRGLPLFERAYSFVRFSKPRAYEPPSPIENATELEP